eukprot:COSAG02_NODE_34259_length_486_cov_69.223932_2_plen_48_part_01
MGADFEGAKCRFSVKRRNDADFGAKSPAKRQNADKNADIEIYVKSRKC